MIHSRRDQPPKTLVCSAIPLGYGPAAKLIVLAQRLRQQPMRLIFVGRGISLELATGHADLFDDVIVADSPSQTSATLWRSAAGLLSIMDRDFVPAAADYDVPLFVVDSLLWMRDELPASWHGARRLWVQNFPGIANCSGILSPAISIVGPIVAEHSVRPATSIGGLLVNLGGCGSPDGDELASSYAEFVVAQFLASPLAAHFPGRTLVVAGRRCIADLQSRFGSSHAEFRSLTHDQTLAELEQRSLVLTAPGLTMTLECFQRGVPTFFLPPQNYSQWCILRTLRNLSLAPAALHWEDSCPGDRLSDRLAEAIRNPIVRRAISDGTHNVAAAKTMQQCLAQVDAAEKAQLALRQQAFFNSLGPNGAAAIADQLTEMLDRRAAGQPRDAALITS